MNKLTLQINNLEALERLIGGDSEVEIEIRNSVASRFAEKHLKPLLNSSDVENVVNRLRAEINKQTTDTLNKEIANFKVTWGEIRDVTVKPEIKAVLDSAVRNAVNKVVADAVSDGLKTWGSEDLLERIIDKRIGSLVEEKIRARINERLEKLKIA